MSLPKSSCKKFHTVALIGKRSSAEASHTVRDLAAWLAERGVVPIVEARTAASLDNCPAQQADLDEIGARADLAVVVGGDGTMLHTARSLARYTVPLVGINQGRLGFMTDIPRSEKHTGLVEILEGHYTSERRFLLNAILIRNGQPVASALALNEVVVSKADAGRMIEFALTIDDEFIYNQRSDGLIIATPTGSTAYALSANGPILHPAVQGIALVPLCPHALTTRPITVSDTVRLCIRLAPGQDARVHCDGQTHFELAGNDEVCITRSEHGITLLHPRAYSYYAMLRAKLHWSEPSQPTS